MSVAWRSLAMVGRLARWPQTGACRGERCTAGWLDTKGKILAAKSDRSASPSEHRATVRKSPRRNEMGVFRWRSWLGASVILFLLYGAANVIAALLVPTTLVRGGAGATGLVLDPDSDAYLAGGKQVLDALRQTNPKLDALLVS